MPCIDSLTPLTASRLDSPNSFNIWNFAVLLGRVGDSTAMLQQMGVSRLIQELLIKAAKSIRHIPRPVYGPPTLPL